MAPHSSTLAWKIPWAEEPGRLQSMGSQRVRYDSATSLSLFTFMHWRRKWQPTPVFLPGESQRRGAWWAAVYGVAQSRTRLKQLSSSSSKVGQSRQNFPLFLNPRTMASWNDNWDTMKLMYRIWVLSIWPLHLAFIHHCIILLWFMIFGEKNELGSWKIWLRNSSRKSSKYRRKTNGYWG